MKCSALPVERPRPKQPRSPPRKPSPSFRSTEVLHEPTQVTDTVLMIRPANFGYNVETAPNNIYQRSPEFLPFPERIQERALGEFDGFVARLRASGVRVIVVDEPEGSRTTDAVFPNNWISTHADGTVVTYPLWAPSRRPERREGVIQALERHGLRIRRKVDYSYLEVEGKFLEGTGSLVLDREKKLAFASLSVRTHERALEHFCRDLAYTPVSFRSSQADSSGALIPVYHSNVMMSVGSTVAIVCSDTIRDLDERSRVLELLGRGGREVVDISEDQCRRFAGNMLQVKSTAGDPILVMSEQAYQALTPDQIGRIEARSGILYAPLPTIETLGGGSARCMLAEVFLPRAEEPLPDSDP
jgi:hypothetical protein